MRGVITRAVLATPEGSRLFADRLTALKAAILDEQRLLARLEQLAARMRPTFAAYSARVAERHDHAVAALAERMRRRIQDVNDELARPFDPLSYNGSGGDEPDRFGGGDPRRLRIRITPDR
jgi:hypothetical protein